MAFISGFEGSIVEFKGEKIRVQAMCVDGTRDGFWICITHQESLHLIASALKHMAEDGDHLMVWKCRIHGVEVP